MIKVNKRPFVVACNLKDRIVDLCCILWQSSCPLVDSDILSHSLCFHINNYVFKKKKSGQAPV